MSDSPSEVTRSPLLVEHTPTEDLLPLEEPDPEVQRSEMPGGSVH